MCDPGHSDENVRPLWRFLSHFVATTDGALDAPSTPSGCSCSIRGRGITR